MLELAAVAAASAFLHWLDRMRFAVVVAVVAVDNLAAVAGLAKIFARPASRQESHC